MLHDLQVGVERHLYEVGLEGDYFQQRPEEVVDAAVADQMLEFIEDFVHPPQEDLSVVGKALDEEQCLFYKCPLLGVFCGSVSKPNDLIEYMFGIVLIGNEHKQANGLIGQRDITGIQALDEHHLPAIQALPVQLGKLMQAANSEVLHVVVVVVEEFVDHLQGLLDEEGGGVDVADCLNGLLQDALAEVRARRQGSAVSDLLLEDLVDEDAGLLVVPAEGLHHLQDLDLEPGRWNAMVVVLLRVLVV